MEPEQLALVLGILTTASIYLAVVGRSLSSYSRAKLDDILEHEVPEQQRHAVKRKLMRTLDRDEPLMLTAYSVRTVVNLCLAAVVGVHLVTFAQSQEPRFSGVMPWFWGGLSLALFLVFAEIVPKALATAFADGLVWSFGGLFRFSLMPLLWIGLTVFSLNRVFRRLFNRIPETEEQALEDRLLSVVSEGESEGVLEEETQDIIESVLEMRDKRVSEIMTPRTALFFIDVNTSLDDAVKLAHESGHSRVPVFERTRDNIVGIFYAKDLLGYWPENARDSLTLRDVLRKPIYVPETCRVDEFLVQMRRGSHMAVVSDEYGGTAGMVTVEDALEEIVGEIRDEYDEGEREPTFHREAPDTIVSDARVHLDEIREELGLELPEDDHVVTLGGFITSRLGRIPRPGETFTFDQIEFRVLEADERRVLKAQLKRVGENGADET